MDGFLTLCMSFFRLAGRKNDIQEKYHAAAGKSASGQASARVMKTRCGAL
jgi:hypothetical protein